MTDFSSVASSAENAYDSIELTNNFFLNDIDLKTIDVETIRKYVNYHLWMFAYDNCENHALWDNMQMIIEHFKKEHFNKLNSFIWRSLRNYYYRHDFWVDYNFDVDRTRAITMLKAVAFEWNDKWTLKQINWAERQEHTLFRITRIRKQELTNIVESNNSDIVTAANSRDLTANSRTFYQNIRLQISLHQFAFFNSYMFQTFLASQFSLISQISHQSSSSQSSN